MTARRTDATAASTPEISVVIATYNRSRLLPRMVAALERQREAPPFDVVIIDDCSSDETPSVLAHLAERATIPVRVRRLDRNRGPAAARNVGWKVAAAPLVAFTDDDCVPSERWLSALGEAFSRADLVQGATAHNPEQGYEGIFSWAPLATEEGPFYETCNMGYRRSVLERTGGFDEHFAARRSRTSRYRSPPWGEDTDLALRAKADGASSTFAADALVWHDTKRGLLRDRILDMPRRRGNVLLVRKHPAIRANFELTYFAERTHAHLVLAFAGLGLAGLGRRHPLVYAPALLTTTCGLARWTRARGAPFPRGIWWRVLPQWMASDVVEILVLAGASVRYRRLLL